MNYNYIIKQFKDAIGVKNINVNSKLFRNELNMWIVERQEVGKNYLSFISKLDNYQFDKECSVAEVGKSAFDTVTSGTLMTLITPFTEEFINETKREIIKGKLLIEDKKPEILICSKIYDSKYIKMDVGNISRFITQNVYEESLIENWESLHNNEYPITLGAFGNVYDKDIRVKIEMLQKLKDKMCNYYIEDYTTINNNYYYAISTEKVNNRTKKKQI